VNIFRTKSFKKQDWNENIVSDVGIYFLLTRLGKHISHRRWYEFGWLLMLMLFSSIMEVVSLGAVVPFIGVLTQPEKVFALPIVLNIANSVGIVSSDDLILPITIMFITAALVAGLTRMLLSWVTIHLTSSIGVELSDDAFRKTLYQPYSIHISRGSSEIISGITQKVITATRVILSVVSIFSSTLLLAAILATLLIINPKTAGIAILCFSMGYLFIAWAVRKRLSTNSKHIAREQTFVVKAVQEGLGAIRDILLHNTQDIYSKEYHKAVLLLNRSNAENTFLNQVPRYLMEIVGMILIAILAYILSFKPGGLLSSLPLIGALALGAQRLLPMSQLLYASWANIASSRSSLIDILKLLEQPLPKITTYESPIPFDFMDEIRLDHVDFRYETRNSMILNNVNLIIKKGSQVGFIGSTGSGKSTMLDLIMFLLVPTNGKILIDGELIDNNELRHAWQNNIAHVPQNIFLSEASVCENIAFGVPKEMIDMSRVKRAAESAQIASFIESHPEKYNIFVGERGVHLSGGQRQRIGIARALYRKANIIIFDEATSALDGAIEEAVIDAIEKLDPNLTILIIAHRLSTLRNCDTIIKLESGKIIAQDTYEFFNGVASQ